MSFYKIKKFHQKKHSSKSFVSKGRSKAKLIQNNRMNLNENDFVAIFLPLKKIVTLIIKL